MSQLPTAKSEQLEWHFFSHYLQFNTSLLSKCNVLNIKFDCFSEYREIIYIAEMAGLDSKPTYAEYVKLRDDLALEPEFYELFNTS